MQIPKFRLLAAGAVAAGCLFSAGLSFADDAAADKSVPEQLVDTMTKLAHGPYKGYRANHAKGIMVSGAFTPAASARALSKAPHLQKGVPVLVRFSDATGVPNIPDASDNANPHGLAIRFQLPKDEYTDIVSISVNGFPAATPEEFLGFLNAVAASGPNVPKPTPVEKFLGAHPATLKFVTTPKPAPVSFGTQAFYGVNAFTFTNAKGDTRYGRYRIVPLAGEKSLAADEVAKAAPDYLFKELPARLKKGPIKFRISVQLADKGDNVNDGTAVWPDDRPQVVLGTLTLKKVLPDSAQVEKSLMFSPLNLVDGIGASDDPILAARPAAYAISYGRRSAD
ncbi:MAG TPA: catalase family peroxidase [Burkholderiales bacterium]|nr:catalase family peroxidase [Burkholderiales bacterium]